MEEYTRKKHGLFSGAFALVVGFILYGLPLLMPKIQGIIGGADGPTSISMTTSVIIGPEWMSEWMMYLTIAIFNPVTLLFFVLLLLYKPIKKRVEKRS